MGNEAIVKAMGMHGTQIIERHVSWVNPPKERYALYQTKHPATNKQDKIAGMTFEEWAHYDKLKTGPDHICSSSLSEFEEIVRLAGKGN